jgi:hypothetical protein
MATQPRIKVRNYNGNKRLKAEGVEWPYTEEEKSEFIKCAGDCEYFISNYMKITHPDHGLIPFKPRRYQIEMIDKIVNGRFTICKLPRQQGKSTIVAAIILWHVIFNKHYGVALLAHKEAQAKEVLNRLKLGYENLPFWLQMGVVEWNKKSIVLDNGSTVEAEATSSGSIRGRTYNMVYMDEFAHVELNEQEDFFTSTYPVISSGQTTKMVITSTPKGMELFYKIWTDSEEGNNSYQRVEAHYSEVPGRDDKWREETIKNTSARQFAQEFECDFLGSMSTLIDGKKIGSIPIVTPIAELENNALWIYEGAKQDRKYCMTVDTSHGKELDFSAFIVVDITEIPYKLVAKYRSNSIPSVFYPDIVYRIAKTYNDALVLVESNDVGLTVVQTLYMDLEYENIFISETKQSGQQIGGMMSGSNKQLGLRMSTQTKRIGCAQIKTIIESDRLLLNDFHIKSEMSTFVAQKNSYAAEVGKNDDLMMCLVMFGWLTHQQYFKDLTELDIRKNLLEINDSLVNEDLIPFGFISGGHEFHGSYIEDDYFEAM